MESYCFKRYRRTAPGQAADEIKFTARNAADAQNRLRRYYLSLACISPMDWGHNFAILEDRAGHVIAAWRDGTPALSP